MRAFFILSAVIFCGFVGVGSTSRFQALYALAALTVAGAAVYARTAVTRAPLRPTR